MTDNPRAQAEQRLVAEMRKRIQDEYDVPDAVAHVSAYACAKLAAEEIARVVLGDREAMGYGDDDPIPWHLVCADEEKGEQP